MRGINHFKFLFYARLVAVDVVLIWQLVDDVAVDDVDTLYVKRMTCSGS
jgi:hypothetical protein